MATSMVDISPIAYGSLGELEDSIKMALKKTGSIKEFDLCAYLSTDDKPFPPSTYLRLRDTDQNTLLSLIREKILNNDPYKTADKVQESPVISPYSGKSLEECIKEAMTKMNVLRDTALCKYIPADEGYLHHFTFLKMKSANPIQLRNLIKEHILDRTPRLISPRKRNRRQPREPLEELSFSRPFKGHNLDSIIIQAMEKMELSLENEENLCRYLPQGNSFVHPLSYRSLKRNNPRKLAQLIKEYVLAPADPKMLEWKKVDRYPSGPNYQSRKREEDEEFEETERSEIKQKSSQPAYGFYDRGKIQKPADTKIDQLLVMVGQLVKVLQNQENAVKAPVRKQREIYGDDLLDEKIPNRYLQLIQSQLIKKIRMKQADEELWEMFIDLI